MYVCACMYLCLWIYMYTHYMHIYNICTLNIYAHMSIYVFVYIIYPHCVCVCMCIYIHMYTNKDLLCTYIYICICICIYKMCVMRGYCIGGGHGNPFQHSCLENLMDRGAWWAIVHRVAKSWTRLKWLSMHASTYCIAQGTLFNIL